MRNRCLVCCILSLMIMASFLDACMKPAKPFHRESELRSYLLALHSFDLSKTSLVNIFILYPNYCGSCYKEGEDFLFQWTKKYPNEDHILILNTPYKIEQSLEKNLSQIYVDSEDQIERYGLLLSSGIFVRFENNNIVFWDYLNNETIERITKSSFQ